MVEVDLVDREEILDNGVRCCFEYLNVKCPSCGRGTDIVITYPDYTEYYHGENDLCKVFWTKESVPPGCELAVNLILMPGYMRGATIL